MCTFLPPRGPPGDPPRGGPGTPFLGAKKGPKNPPFSGVPGAPRGGGFRGARYPLSGGRAVPQNPLAQGAESLPTGGPAGEKNRRLGASLKLPCEGLRQLAYATQLSLTRGDPLRGYNLRPVGLDCRQPSAILLTWDYATLRGDTRCRARHVSSLREDVIVRLAADATAVSPVTSRLTNL